MPLPAALLARLAKRGIVKKDEKKAPEEVEEVFAEDYDEPMQTNDTENEKEETESESVLIHQVISCPNKSNPYHECVDYCKEHYGIKTFETTDSDERKRKRMLKKYPLPIGWDEVADPETGRFYYWNTVTDEVSWLSPSHPMSKVTLSAEKLKALMISGGFIETDTPKEDQQMEEDDEHDVLEAMENEYRKKRKDKERRAKERKTREKDVLDPMDPAAYSDIPRGDWSSGLEDRSAAKTGVDSTASGPLFQQRPYPSPGAVLRANKEATDR